MTVEAIWDIGRLAGLPGVRTTLEFDSLRVSPKVRESVLEALRRGTCKGGYSSKTVKVAAALSNRFNVPLLTYFDHGITLYNVGKPIRKALVKALDEFQTTLKVADKLAPGSGNNGGVPFDWEEMCKRLMKGNGFWFYNSALGAEVALVHAFEQHYKVTPAIEQLCEQFESGLCFTVSAERASNARGWKA